MAPSMSQHWGMWCAASNLTTHCQCLARCEWNTFFSHQVLIVISSTAHVCVFMWNESFMPVVHEVSQPTHNHRLILPGPHPASVSIPRAYTYKLYWIIITESLWWPTKPLFLHPWVSASLQFISWRLRLCLCLSVSSPPSRSGRPTFQHFQWCASEICFQGNRGTKYSPGGFSLVRPLFTLFISLRGWRLF